MSERKSRPPVSGNTAIEQLVTRARPSVVTLSHQARDGKEAGLGTGFLISDDGLVATCLHVISEGRPISVRFADGQRFGVREIHSWDRKLDLAVLRLESDKTFPFLKLGDSDALRQGGSILAIGNPLGLEQSVVTGVVSARREVEGREMIQLAIPIEPGNSGGPLLDLEGQVHGILNMKSAVTANLGFAIPINALRSLLQKPNTVSLQRWLNLGGLNPLQWKSLFGAQWVQKAGRIEVDHPGTGFGGRAVCLWQGPVPDPVFELGVQVRLDDESGAAGLVFLADGQDKHFGFYPSGGRLRLTRFEGPSVFSWNILEEISSRHYRPGEWNHLKVRVEGRKISCFVNGQLIIESSNERFDPGQAGLAKFRQTRAQFRDFEVAESLTTSAPEIPADLADQVTQLLSDPPKSDREVLAQLEPYPDAARRLLADKALKMEAEAGRLRRLGVEVHRLAVRRKLEQVMGAREDEIDLLHAALLISKLDNPDLDVEAYRASFDRLAQDLAGSLPADLADLERLSRLTQFVFSEQGFHGSRSDYYNAANSYIDRVLDDREGLPITLSLVFLELGRRIGLKGLVGIPLPGHFVVRYTPDEGAARLIDVFDAGKTLSPADAALLVTSTTGDLLREEHLAPATKKEIVLRMLRNLQAAAERSKTLPVHYLDAIVTLAPESVMERLNRAMLRLEMGEKAGAREDLQWLIKREPPGLDLDRLAELLRRMEEGATRSE